MRFAVLAIFSVSLIASARAEGPDPKKIPAIKRALDKAEVGVRRNRKAYDDANEKTFAEAEKALQEEVDRLSKAGKPEEAVAVKKLLDSFKTSVLRTAETKKTPAHPAKDGAVSWNGHKYKYFNDPLTWMDAKEKCEAVGGYLVIIDDRAEQEFLIQSLSRLGEPSLSVWVGITSQDTPGKWRTMKGDRAPFENWGQGEPGGDPTAMMNLGWGGRWNDVPGNIRITYVCEWDE